MSVLRKFESGIAGLVEGAFSRAFKSEVRPVEIARKLVREMEEHRVVSVSRSYVPNEYTVYLSPDDRAQFSGYETSLCAELSAYLLEHARRERLALASTPEVAFVTDERLKLGEFGIQARTIEPGEPDHEPAQGDRGRTMVYSTSDRLREQREGDMADSRRAAALLVVDGKRIRVGAGGATVGRSRDCDVVLQDANVSRHHAEVRPAGGAWALVDLGSTNGVKLNGRRIDGAQTLRPGDRISLGTTTMTFQLDT